MHLIVPFLFYTQSESKSKQYATKTKQNKTHGQTRRSFPNLPPNVQWWIYVPQKLEKLYQELGVYVGVRVSVSVFFSVPEANSTGETKDKGEENAKEFEVTVTTVLWLLFQPTQGRTKRDRRGRARLTRQFLIPFRGWLCKISERTPRHSVVFMQEEMKDLQQMPP